LPRSRRWRSRTPGCASASSAQALALRPDVLVLDLKMPLKDGLTVIQELKALIAQGLSNQEAADRLVISERTVAGHVRNILGKLHLASRTQTALYAIRAGLSDPNAGSNSE